ncbi:MAG TPA: radical SAM protein, partial [Bdellovibrionota bacterium]|nr:radical SAM protein [Bdellovibrionota bacterium]
PHATPLSPAERDAVFDRVREFLREIRSGRPPQFFKEGELFIEGEDANHELDRMEAALRDDSLERQWRQFKNVYGSVPILPPDCYGSLLIQATTGCSYQKCLFCALYENRPFQIRDPKDFEAHVTDALRFQGRALARWRSIFLGDANALVVPQDKLVELLSILQTTLSKFEDGDLAETLYAFTDAGRPIRTLDEYKGLHERGLRRVYIGLETGFWPLREWLKKSGNEATLTEKIDRLKNAGIGVGLIIIAGVGGKTLAEQHIRETVSVIRSYPLDAGDIIYVSPLREQATTAYPEWVHEKQIQPLSEDEVWNQTRILMSQLAQGWKTKPPKVAPYDISRFVY